MLHDSRFLRSNLTQLSAMGIGVTLSTGRPSLEMLFLCHTSGNSRYGEAAFYRTIKPQVALSGLERDTTPPMVVAIDVYLLELRRIICSPPFV